MLSYARGPETPLLNDTIPQALMKLGLPDRKVGEAVLAWVRLKAGASATEEEIREFCGGKIAHFKIPQFIRFVDRSRSFEYVCRHEDLSRVESSRVLAGCARKSFGIVRLPAAADLPASDRMEGCPHRNCCDARTFCARLSEPVLGRC